MKSILTRLTNHETLTAPEARDVLVRISEGEFNPAQIAAFLTVFMMRPITIAELSGFRQALLELCVPVDFSGYETIDLCGTGGDGKDTFNISTLTSLVVAGCGIKVAKHGNYGVSSVSGSSNVLENLGVKFSSEPGFLERCLDEAGMAVLHAPLFHPAMKIVGPIRKELAVRTFFNLLGPMVNPSRPKHQLTGVFSLELARMYAYLYQETEVNYSIVHSLDGYDEISLTGAAKVISADSERILEPRDFGYATVLPEAISGGSTISDATKIFTSILSGTGTDAQKQAVCANAALAISMLKKNTLPDAVQMAEESLASGRAANVLEKLQNLSK